jgi:hypothetical protein
LHAFVGVDRGEGGGFVEVGGGVAAEGVTGQLGVAGRGEVVEPAVGDLELVGDVAVAAAARPAELQARAGTE